MKYNNVRICPACGDGTTVYHCKETDDEIFKRYRKCKSCKYRFVTIEIMIEEMENSKDED